MSRNIQFEDLSKEQLCKLAEDVTRHNFDLQWTLKEISFADETLMDCWLVHPIDDDDCDDVCPIVKGCRGVRSHADKLQAKADSRDALLAACRKIQSTRDAFRKNGTDFDHNELDRVLDEAIEAGEK